MGQDEQSVSIEVFVMNLYAYLRRECDSSIVQGKRIIVFTIEMLHNAGIVHTDEVSPDRLAWAIGVHTRLNDAIGTPIGWMCQVRDYTRRVVGDARFQRWSPPYNPSMKQAPTPIHSPPPLTRQDSRANSRRSSYRHRTPSKI